MAKKRKTKEEIIINNPEPSPETEIKPEARDACAASLLAKSTDEAKSEPEIKYEPKPYKRPLRRL